MRRSRAEANVAGIEIENSRFADVYENKAMHNTGGILVFNLPDLPVKGGGNTRVFNNEVAENNTQNFGAKGSMVAKVPTGTGVIVLATNHVEVFKNTIKDNNTANVSVISYFTTGNPINDATYYPFPEAIYVHDNTISGGGTAPSGEYADALAPVVGKPMPAILFDGVVNPQKLGAAKRLPDDLRICIQNNGDANFMNYDAGGHFKHASRDLKPFACALTPLSAVNLPAADGGRSRRRQLARWHGAGLAAWAGTLLLAVDAAVAAYARISRNRFRRSYRRGVCSWVNRRRSNRMRAWSPTI